MEIGIRAKAAFFILVFVQTLILPAAWAGNRFIDYQGVSVFHGRSDGTGIGPDTVDAYEWTTLNYTLGKNLTTWTAFETLLGAGYLESEHYGDTTTLEARVLADVHYKFLFLKFGVGIAHLFDDDNLPGLAETGIHGIISGSAGFRFRFHREKKPPVVVSLGYGVEHVSAPFKHGDDGDDGWNTGGVLFTLSCPL
ncbi:hypothetical protein [Desulfobacter vibrioformis]|uniref:hypothetical protein n=1 Tax=Desulfobacter vibrioformis TaxID=34031 RepID=UPI000556DFED|nr:hypothetical protein [Desulfobacter vibrioformis]